MAGVRVLLEDRATAVVQESLHRGIELTDAPLIGPTDDCPRCGAPSTAREKNTPFGADRHDVCTRCGFEEFT